MHLGGPTHSHGGCFTEAKKSNLSLLDQLAHCANGLLDRCLRIDSMLVEQIDRLYAQPLEARLACNPHILTIAARQGEATFGRADVAELRREDHLVAPVTDG